jgi:hypothetical protein
MHKYILQLTKQLILIHTTEILSGIRKMKPQLEKKELKKILSGACQAVQLVLSCMTNLKNISIRGAL